MMKIKKFIFKSYLTITRMFFSIRQINRCHCGTKVITPSGMVGICLCGYFGTDGSDNITLAMRWRIVNHCNRKIVEKLILEEDLIKVISFENLRIGLFSWWKWYKNNWLDIDVRCMLEKRPLSSVEVSGKKASHGRRF